MFDFRPSYPTLADSIIAAKLHEASSLEHGYASGQFDRPLPGGPDYVEIPAQQVHSDDNLAKLGRSLSDEHLTDDEAIAAGKLYVGHPYY